MDRIINILKTLGRPGTDKVIEFMEENNYKGSRCYGHHKYAGGLVDHSLEVYNHMMQNSGELPKDSIIVCAFFHDLGKATKSRRQIKDHEGRSIRILDKCGFTLTDQERNAILTHHKIEGFLDDPLRRRLSQADLDSTGRWKEANDPNYNSSLAKTLKHIGLKFISKL
jgi:putative nucleotidyltransferase with HDIG domain